MAWLTEAELAEVAARMRAVGQAAPKPPPATSTRAAYSHKLKQVADRPG